MLFAAPPLASCWSSRTLPCSPSHLTSLSSWDDTVTLLERLLESSLCKRECRTARLSQTGDQSFSEVPGVPRQPLWGIVLRVIWSHTFFILLCPPVQQSSSSFGPLAASHFICCSSGVKLRNFQHFMRGHLAQTSIPPNPGGLPSLPDHTQFCANMQYFRVFSPHSSPSILPPPPPRVASG